MSTAFQKCQFCDAEFHGEANPRTADENAFVLLGRHAREQHADKLMDCPRREEVPNNNFPKGDFFRSDHTCSYCGSLSPEAFFKAIEDGEKLGPTDKSYKVYVGSGKKFYFQHLNDEQKQRFVDLLNAGKMNIGYPGHFYRLPFFIQSEARK